MMWPEWMFRRVPSVEAGAALLVTATILAIWGLTLIAAAYHDADRRRLPSWHWQVWLPPTFSYWLGLFMALDSLIYFLFAAAILRRDNGVDAWVFVLCLTVAATATIALFFWARDRRGPR